MFAQGTRVVDDHDDDPMIDDHDATEDTVALAGKKQKQKARGLKAAIFHLQCVGSGHLKGLLFTIHYPALQWATPRYCIVYAVVEDFTLDQTRADRPPIRQPSNEF